MGRKIHTDGPRIKKLAKEIGKIYKDAAKDPDHAIDREKLVKALEKAIISRDKSEKKPDKKNRKTLMFDVVVDEDLDHDTRLVWIALPTPDLEYDNGAYQGWKDYMKENLDYNESADDFDSYDKLEKLTEAILFGCGR